MIKQKKKHYFASKLEQVSELVLYLLSIQIQQQILIKRYLLIKASIKNMNQIHQIALLISKPILIKLFKIILPTYPPRNTLFNSNKYNKQINNSTDQFYYYTNKKLINFLFDI
ncbi:hypothetical protein ABPG72_005856 [Tetrahymena utriculariae]